MDDAIKLTYKLELSLTNQQKYWLDQEIGISRWAYNHFIEANENRYNLQQFMIHHLFVNFYPFVSMSNLIFKNISVIKQTLKYLNGYDFSKYFNNVYFKTHPDDTWIKGHYTKNIKQAFLDADRAYRSFMKGKSGFPRFRSYRRNDGSFYVVRNSKTTPIKHNRWQIKVPKLKTLLRFKTIGYLPKKSEILSLRIKRKANRYYLTAIVEKPIQKQSLQNNPIGIDLGVKNFAICSNTLLYRNLNKDSKVRKIRKRLRRLQRQFSRQLIAYRKRVNKYGKREATDFNLAKTKLRMQKLYQHLTNIIFDYQNKIISELVRTKPKYLAIEDLNIKGMMKNRHLAKAIQQQAFYQFRTRLINKCKYLSIPVHVVKRIYASSKRCHNCGFKNKNLQLKDRIWTCDNCKTKVDRDYNASLNIRDTDQYDLAY